MNAFDVEVIKGPGETRTCQTSDWTADATDHSEAFQVGEVMKECADHNFVCMIGTGDPEAATDMLVGIVRKAGTETSSADGTVEVITLTTETILRCAATTSTNFDTQSGIDALIHNYVCFDVTASTGHNGVITIDEDETSDPDTHGLCIVGGDPITKKADVRVNVRCTEMGPLTTS